MQGNVGLIFTKGDLKEVSEEVAKYKVGAPARVGLVAPIDVVVPPGNTGLDPSQTSFFQVDHSTIGYIGKDATHGCSI
ncbi:uncharacterized protein A4U43_C02F160 [Asparagus officinalis]|uniref:60S ribosomal protein L10P insertion domain-containing protein n=1 Tax=Asparagus officinalis TaxID=4686 RepID=A0A5P1FIU1_ASPOF|nr:uncharacterized protein A4U43_C02F160 [Asparagus officinalis]